MHNSGRAGSDLANHSSSALTPEQLLIIAEEFCERFHTRIRSHAALVAIAAIPRATLSGIRIFNTEDAALTSMADTIRRLEPLQGYNTVFAEVVLEISHKHNELC